MKKITAVLLSILMIFSVSVSGLCVLAADGSVRVIATDTKPISLEEVEATKYSPWFNLEASEIDYGFSVIMPDGSVQTLVAEDEVSAEGIYDKTTGTVVSKYLSYGYAFVEFEDAEEAKASGSFTVPVHVCVTVNEYNAEKSMFEKLGEYEFVLNKRLVESYIRSITPVSGLPTYIYEKSDAVDFSNTEFEIEYWDLSKKTVKAEAILPVYEKAEYSLNDVPFRYAVNRDTKKIYVSYIDGTCMIDYKTEKEFPFSEIELLGCTIDGDMPTSIRYCIKWKNGRSQDYSVTVNSYSGYIGYVEGYSVSFSTEGSKFTSTVTVKLGEELSDSKSYEAEQQGFFAKLIAKLALFLKQIFSSIF